MTNKPDLGRAAFDQAEPKEHVKWELFMAALAVVFVWLAFANDDGALGLVGPYLELGLILFFIGEFLVRLRMSEDRAEYAVDHWLDVVALVPVVPGLRFLRMLRLLRLLRFAGGLHRASGTVRRLQRVQTLVNLVIAWLVVMAIGGISFWAAESEVNLAVNDPFDALWWATTTITGGQSEIIPATGEGRAAAAILLLGGVALFAAITASVFRLLGAEVEPPAPVVGRESRPEQRIAELVARYAEGSASDEELDLGMSSIAVEVRSGRISCEKGGRRTPPPLSEELPPIDPHHRADRLQPDCKSGNRGLGGQQLHLRRRAGGVLAHLD